MTESAKGDLWVFGYGSLIWRPDFEHDERRPALMEGCRRRFAMWSLRYRGTETAPGLVLTLEEAPGASCQGVAYRVGAARAETVLACLRAREMLTGAYCEQMRPVRLLDGAGETVQALCYMIRRDHPQYAGGLSLEAQARIIARAHGAMGPNAEYLFNTLAALEAEKAEDAELERLGALTRKAFEEGASE